MKRSDVLCLRGGLPARILFVILIGLLLFGGCNSDDNATGGGPAQGVFLDSAVAQLTYVTPTYSGKTDINGTFTYIPGETISFYIGGQNGLLIGKTQAKSRIMPNDLTQDNNVLTNMVRLLQALDINDDPTNGIYLDQNRIDAIDLSAIDLNQSKDTFSVSGLTLPSEADAIAHFTDTYSVVNDEPAALDLNISQDLNAMIIPFPNDILWAQTGGKVMLDPNLTTDPAFKALYTAVDALDISGFSPNTTIWVPLKYSTALNTSTLENHIKIYQITETSLAQITNFKIVQDYKTIKIVPLAPLSPGVKFLVVFENGILDVNGNELQQPQIFTLLESTQPLSGMFTALEPIRQNYEGLFSLINSQLSLTRDDIIEMFTFTTADKTLSLQELALVGAAAAGSMDLSAITVHGLSYGDTNSNGMADIVEEYETFAQAVPLFANNSQVADDYFLSFDITTLADSSPVPLEVPYMIYNQSAYSDTVSIFQHGFGRNKTDASALTIDFPVVAMDLPEHGSRRSSACTGTPDGYCYLSTNIGQDRVNLYQSYFDLSMMLKLLEKGDFDINGDASADQPQHVYFGGQSMGSITGSVFVAHNSSDLEKIVLNVGGANLTSMLDNATSSFILGLMDSLDMKPDTLQYYMTLALFQTLLDPADPVYLANAAYINQPSYKSKTLLQTAYMDTLVPNIANEVLANTIGFNIAGRVDITDFDNFDVNNYLNAGWYQYGAKSGKTDNYINHGFLLNTQIDGYHECVGYLDANYVMAAHNAVLEQYNAFYKN